MDWLRLTEGWHADGGATPGIWAGQDATVGPAPIEITPDFGALVIALRWEPSLKNVFKKGKGKNPKACNFTTRAPPMVSQAIFLGRGKRLA